MPNNNEKSIIRSDMKKRFKDFLHSQIELHTLDDQGLSATLFADVLCSTELYKQSDIVLAYASMVDEAPAFNIIEQCLLDGKKLALPKIQKNTMDFFFIDEGMALEKQLCKNFCGIDEPLGFLTPFVPEDVLQSSIKVKQNILVIVPALAFTKQGHRLGRGGGFFDRYLAQILEVHSALASATESAHENQATGVSVTFCGMCYSFQVLDTLPCEKHDVNMQCILTEKKLVFCEYDTTIVG